MRQSYLIGKRVEIPPHTDSWMRGDRFGTVVLVTGSEHDVRLSVRLDKSGRNRRFLADECRFVD